MKSSIKAFLLALLASTAVTTSYACYGWFWQPQCARPGDCYGSCTPQGCSQGTCIIADSYGYQTGWNTLSDPQGGYYARVLVGSDTCQVSSCKIYNNCTSQYESLPPGCSCDFQVTKYEPFGSGCQ